MVFLSRMKHVFCMLPQTKFPHRSEPSTVQDTLYTCTYYNVHVSTVVSRASTHSWVSAHVPHFKGSMEQLLYKHVEVMSRVSAHEGQNHELRLSAHGHLPGTLRYFHELVNTYSGSLDKGHSLLKKNPLFYPQYTYAHRCLNPRQLAICLYKLRMLGNGKEVFSQNQCVTHFHTLNHLLSKELLIQHPLWGQQWNTK